MPVTKIILNNVQIIIVLMNIYAIVYPCLMQSLNAEVMKRHTKEDVLQGGNMEWRKNQPRNRSGVPLGVASAAAVALILAGWIKQNKGN
jgi:hypothetical protein